MALNRFSHPSSSFAAPFPYEAAPPPTAAPLVDVAEPARPESPLSITQGVQLPANSEFHDGFNCGWLAYCFDYKETPITGRLITNFLYTHMHDPSASASWNAGYCLGWLAHVFCPDPSIEALRAEEARARPVRQTQDKEAAADGRSLDLGDHQLVLFDDGSLDLISVVGSVHLTAEETYRLLISLQERFK
ncbi:MAG: hypothetical protein IMW89_08355 [Ktedonobacteraceae bacterium]|nr:hypothetical protein [Ktedonobacteraceae bacterium]